MTAHALGFQDGHGVDQGETRVCNSVTISLYCVVSQMGISKKEEIKTSVLAWNGLMSKVRIYRPTTLLKQGLLV